MRNANVHAGVGNLVRQ